MMVYIERRLFGYTADLGINCKYLVTRIDDELEDVNTNTGIGFVFRKLTNLVNNYVTPSVGHEIKHAFCRAKVNYATKMAIFATVYPSRSERYM